MDIIIRPAETSDFDSVVHILNQVQDMYYTYPESGSGFACELAALYLQRK